MPHEPRRLFHPDPAQGASAPEHAQAAGAKETVISLLIAFALAFVFRGYVVEPYVIPTNSMAPTLLGAHIRWVDPANGFDWPTTHFFGAGNANDPRAGPPLPHQGGVLGGVNFGPLTAFDPMTREVVQYSAGQPTRSGDRIFVLRYLWPLFTPQRWDVVVFKTPTPAGYEDRVSTGATQAFIKRLVGLPGEEIAIVDGDIFTRPNDGAPAPTGKTRWDLPDWKVAVKHERAQRAVWQPIFSSSFAIATDSNGRPFQGPFLGGPGWDVAGKTSYTYAGSGPTTLTWDASADDAINYDGLFAVNAQVIREQVQKRWTLTDAYAMDDVRTNTVDPRAGAHAQTGQMFFYPVSDLRLSAGVQPAADGESFAAVLRTRGHEFRGRLSPKADAYEAVLEMRALPADASAPWTTLASAPAPSRLAKGVVTNVEFWHADQQLQLWVDDGLAVSAPYNWSIADRIQFTLGVPTTDLVGAKPGDGVDYARSMLLRSGKNYSRPRPWFELSGPATLHRVRVDRDLYYQPIAGPKLFAGGAHPNEEFAKKLSGEQYFVCGDNSPMSSDARAWTDVDKWVFADIDPTAGVVNKRLFVGKAFFVYFPAVQTRQIFGTKIPMVDAGRARWIW